MPHCTLEISDNIKISNKKNFLIEINKCLANTNLFQLNDIKTRLIIHQNYIIGDSESIKAFANLNISIFEGRNQETKNMISEKCIEILKKQIETENKNQKLDITVQISEINKKSYRKTNINI
ncbi:MAG: hypothetical protein JXR51_00990 [Bacteroidales bacterium]|nr:hypothetical protein [Bacteroidales bacterium]